MDYHFIIYMNINKNLNELLSTAKSLAGQITDRIKAGSKNSMDYYYASYYSGVVNTLTFMKYLRYNTVNEKKFSELSNGLLNIRMETVNAIQESGKENNGKEGNEMGIEGHIYNNSKSKEASASS